MIAVSSHSVEQTAAIAAAVAKLLEKGDVIALEGPVGAGKTQFVKCLAEALGSTDPVRSPTYTVGHLLDLGDGRTLAHLDLYRSESVDESAWGDIEPYFDADVVAVEWPAAGMQWLEGRMTWKVRIGLISEDARVIRIAPPADISLTFSDCVIARILP